MRYHQQNAQLSTCDILSTLQIKIQLMLIISSKINNKRDDDDNGDSHVLY